MSDATAAIREVDASGLLDAALALPEHLRDALWRAESARIAPFEATGLVISGMGGSAIGGMLARSALGDRLRRPLLVVRDYELGAWTPLDHAVLCSSYSGETEEVLACFEAAEALGTARIVATTGGALADAARQAKVPVIGLPSGLQPRSAVGYMFAIATEVAALTGAANAIRTEIDSAAAQLEADSSRLLEEAGRIADQLDGAVPIVYGCDLTAPVAYRWKTQLNENAKLAAFAGELPEMNHNEIVGWQRAAESGRFAAVFLTDRDQHPRERQRFELSSRMVEPQAAATVTIETEGETRTGRLLWAVLVGDLVSLHLAARRGVDPAAIEPIDELKAALEG